MKMKSFRALCLAGLLGATAALSGCESEYVVESGPPPSGVAVTVAPPPARFEPAPVCGYRGAWIAGHWHWAGRWVWQPGHCARVRRGYVWVRPYWAAGVYYRGYWAPRGYYRR